MIELVEAHDIFGYSVFCDDIRMEIDGKFTFVGVYGGRLYINGQFPATLPKFGIAITFYQLKTMFVPNLGLRIFLPGDSEEEASIQGDFGEVQDGALRQHIESQPPIPGSTYIALTANVVVSSLVLKEPGVITARVLRENKLYRAGRLAVMQGTIIAPPTSPSPLA